MHKNIHDDDFLGRAVFSSGQVKRAIRGNIDFNIFFYKESRSLSVDRFGFCSKKILTQIQDKNAELRSRTEGRKRSFYGWAKIEARDVRKNGGTVQATPIKDNPYHADINLPENIEVDEKINYAKKLASDSKWTPRLNGIK
ncbi:MAG: hypothetical protein OXH36_02835 [Bdellovibrionales bacterium]|nr:hypothetical protein [Bdellovibrionales bacterium]